MKRRVVAFLRRILFGPRLARLASLPENAIDAVVLCAKEAHQSSIESGSLPLDYDGDNAIASSDDPRLRDLLHSLIELERFLEQREGRILSKELAQHLLNHNKLKG